MSEYTVFSHSIPRAFLLTTPASEHRACCGVRSHHPSSRWLYSRRFLHAHTHTLARIHAHIAICNQTMQFPSVNVCRSLHPLISAQGATRTTSTIQQHLSKAKVASTHPLCVHRVMSCLEGGLTVAPPARVIVVLGDGDVDRNRREPWCGRSHRRLASCPSLTEDPKHLVCLFVCLLRRRQRKQRKSSEMYDLQSCCDDIVKR
jgi:hypothetical protein